MSTDQMVHRLLTSPPIYATKFPKVKFSVFQTSPSLTFQSSSCKASQGDARTTRDRVQELRYTLDNSTVDMSQLTRSSGKQSVYHVTQGGPQSSSEEIAQLETTMTTLREEIAHAKAKEKAVKNEIVSLGVVTTTEDLQTTIERLSGEKEDLLSQLENIKKVEISPISEEEKTAAEEARKIWKKQADARKRILKELWEKLVDAHQSSQDMPPSELWVSAAAYALDNITVC